MLILIAVLLVTLTVRHAPEPVYRLPAAALVTISLAGLACVTASLLLVVMRQPRLIALTALAVFLFVFGLLALFSIGLLLILLSAVVIVVLGRATSGVAGRDAVTHLGTGTALGLSLLVLLVIGMHSPLVECRDDGVATHSREWWGGSQSTGSGSGSVAPDGSASGEIRLGTEAFRYACEGDTLVEFEQVE